MKIMCSVAEWSATLKTKSGPEACPSDSPNAFVIIIIILILSLTITIIIIVEIVGNCSS